ncbi:hypothetical protein GOP47_0027323 [Adiantum capillus-veneris]|nr:hypothetical protein GOP47_0027323 [Adiantum capillus-veneris]
MQLLECTTTFVEQGVKEPMLSCLLTETPSLALERSLLDEHRKVQDSFTMCVPDCKSKGSNTDGPPSQLAATVIPHWMSSKQELQVKISTSINNGFSTNMAISKPQTPQEDLFSHSQKSREPYGTLSAPSRGIETEQQNDMILMQSKADESNSKHLFQKRPPAFSVGLKPLEAPSSREEQKENSKVDLVSFLLQKQQKQATEGCPKALSGLPLGHRGGKASDKKAELSSWVSRFPFQIGPEANSPDELVEFRRPIHHGQFLEHKKDYLLTNNGPSQLAGSKNHNGQSKFQPSSTPIGAVKPGFPQNTQLIAVSSTSKWASTETSLGSDMPSLKRDWNAALMQSVSVKNPQILPDFFAQQKVTTAGKANLFRLPEIKCKDLFSDKSLSSMVGEENSDINRNTSRSHQYMEQQQEACGRVTREKPSHNSLSQLNMLKVKNEASSEDFEALQCAKSASRECVVKNCRKGDFGGKFSPVASQTARQLSYVGLDVNKAISNSQATELMLFAECASSQLLGNSSHVSASVSQCSVMKQSTGLERRKTVPEGDWGEFLAGSKAMPATETPVKIVPPFQQRFEQLQEFLRNCDGSDKFYCWQAFHMLSANACSDHVVELESRALKLSFVEGKEMKRARLLNVLDEVPDGPFLTACSRPMGPWFLSPQGWS